MARLRAPSLAALLLAALLPSGAGCRKEQRPGAPPPSAPAAKAVKRGLDAASPALAKAARAAVLDCDVSELGLLRSCRGAELEAELAKQEGVVGARAALAAYCRALSDEDHRIRALASARIARFAFAQTLREQGDASLLSCLLEALPRARPGLLARPLARAAALLAPREKREAALLAALRTHPTPEVQVAGYEALYAGGRLRLLPTIRKLLAEQKDPRLRVALLSGLGAAGRLEGEERDRVCALLEESLREKEASLAAVAAGSLALACEGGGEKVLAAAEARLEARTLDAGYLRAVRSVAGLLLPRASTPTRQRALALLGRAAESEGLVDAVRAAALLELALLERRAAQKLARKLGAKASPELAAAAATVLEKKQRPY
jgi:hypothetical protein